jgi:hypothetical protein
MKTSALKYTVLTWVSGLVMLILFLVPFQGFLTVWGAHLFGHYTVLRLWDEVILALCIIGALYLLITDHKIRFNTLSRRVVWLILGYIVLTLAWGAIFYSSHEVTAKALGYGLIVNLRYLAFFLVTWAVALRIGRLRAHWQKLVIWPAIAVIVFGLLEIFILPHNFLEHFGYGPKTIPVMETINHNTNYIRYQSTLRGANPLGAYLIIPISVMTVLITRNKRNWQRLIFLLGAVVLLFYTFSRSAWLGALVSTFIIYLTGRLSRKLQKIALASGATLLVIVIGSIAIFHNNTRFQNFVFHTQAHSTIKSTSDGDHISALKNGLSDLARHPLGKGPGTAGPASLYNDGKTRISEDYFIQIGQEVGWLGLTMFLLINVGVGYLLWLRRDDPLALSLFASLIGITLVNLLLYAWSDDTLAYIWWGLAGLAMAPDTRLTSITSKEPQD